MEKSVEILLSTFNGENYLEDQLNSLFNQTYDDFIVSIRDDGSTDGTIAIINKFVSDYPDRIFLVSDEKKRLGSTFSFERLLAISTSNYIMFCDQDDFWLHDKVEKTLSKMLESEKKYPDKPILIYTDLKEVDEQLRVIEESFIKNQKLYPYKCTTDITLLALNVVAGCTCMINKASKKYVLPFPGQSIIHDQWIAINVAHYGKVVFLDQTTILYRQHTNNAVGAKKIGIKYFVKKILIPKKQFKIYLSIIRNLKFKISIIQFIYYKLYFTLKRL